MGAVFLYLFDDASDTSDDRSMVYHDKVVHAPGSSCQKHGNGPLVGVKRFISLVGG
ncbi:hypothetical protein RchiOBHm_Chr4g0428971 [Rosa chinensis]|uniref:Uncharacterized protein n=1 Tax=Rosa chinensis TaxID=74649 RepID=A0A2P6R022_ROSCH|nr:hypothetical protein RchiOBHm_Chr7g0179291 [Rosa chinensis]PRQ39781.1 hypothetical protein RchiOBHm_Chr4g0428971 [Rosa chinensis]